MTVFGGSEYKSPEGNPFWYLLGFESPHTTILARRWNSLVRTVWYLVVAVILLAVTR